VTNFITYQKNRTISKEMAKISIKTEAEENAKTSTAVQFGRGIMDTGRTGGEGRQVTALGRGNQ
jgi:hypothetical protein